MVPRQKDIDCTIQCPVFNESDHGVEKEPSEEEEKWYIDEEPFADEAAEPVLQQSEREIQPPNYYGERVTIANGKTKEPVHVEEALGSPDKAKWLNAMEMEIESLHVNDAWDWEVVGSKWVFKASSSRLVLMV